MTAGLTPFVIFGASFAFGIFVWILPEVGNCYSKVSNAVFPVQDEGQFGAGDEQEELEDGMGELEEEDGEGEDRDKEDEENGREETRGALETLEDEAEASAPASPRMTAVMLLLHSYINSVLGLDKGVFSGHSFVYRLWYEWSLHNAYFAPLRTEMNGPYGFLVESREEFVMPSAPSSSLPQQQTYISQHAKIVLSSGAWNRAVRAIRLVTNLNVAFTVLGLLYYHQYPDMSSDVVSRCQTYGTKTQCLADSISFLESVPYCVFKDSAGTCAANTDPPLSIQFLVLCTLLAALVMTPLQWPLDALFSSFLVFPKIETPAFSSFSAAPPPPLRDDDHELTTAADEPNLRQTQPGAFQDQDDDVYTACPSVDNARRHSRLQGHFDSLDSQRRHTALLSSLESGVPMSPLGHLAMQADRDVVAEVYASFPVSRLHRLEDRNMRRLVELLALLESLKGYRSTMGAGVERLAFERQWGVVAAPDSIDDFYLIGKSMLVRDDQTTLYDLACMHLFHAADNYVDVTEVEIRMAEAKKAGLEACRALRAAARRQSPQQSECLTAFELVRHFGADFLGGSQSVAGRVFMAKSATSLPFCLGVSGMSHRWRWAAVLAANAVAVAIILGIFTKVSTGWELGWFAACCMHVVLDSMAYQTCAAVLTGFVLPDQVRRTVRHSLLLVAPTFEYIWAATEDPECAAPLGISAEDVKQSLLCAPKFLYASRKLADSLPHKFEGDLVRRFNTAWLMPALRPVPGQAHAATAVSAHAARMQMGASLPRASSSTVRPFSPSTPQTLPVARERPNIEQEEGALTDPEPEHDGADALMEEGFGESESFLRALLLRMCDLPVGLQRTLINLCQIFFALVLGYAAFTTNPSDPIANAVATYILLYIPWVIVCVSPYLPLPSCRSIRRALPVVLGTRKAVVAPAEDMREGAALEGLMLKALERASRLLDEDEYVLRERTGPRVGGGGAGGMHASSSAASVAFTDDSHTDESESPSVRLGSRQEDRGEKGADSKVDPEPEPSKSPFPSPSVSSATRVAPEPQPQPAVEEEEEEKEEEMEMEVDWSEMNEPKAAVSGPPAPAAPGSPKPTAAAKKPPSKKVIPAKVRNDPSLLRDQDDDEIDVGDQSDVSAAFRARMEKKARMQSDARNAGAPADEGAAREAGYEGTDQGAVSDGQRAGGGGLGGRATSERMRLDDLYDEDDDEEGASGQHSDLSFNRKASAGFAKLTGLGKAYNKTFVHGQAAHGQAEPAEPFPQHEAMNESAKLHGARQDHLKHTIEELESQRLETEKMEQMVQRNRLLKQESRLSEKRWMAEQEAQEEERIFAEFEREEAERLAAARRLAAQAQSGSAQPPTMSQGSSPVVKSGGAQGAEERISTEQRSKAEAEALAEPQAQASVVKQQTGPTVAPAPEVALAQETPAVAPQVDAAPLPRPSAETDQSRPAQPSSDALGGAGLDSERGQGSDWVPPSQRAGFQAAPQVDAALDTAVSAKWVSPEERVRKAAAEKTAQGDPALPGGARAQEGGDDWVPPSARVRVAEKEAEEDKDKEEDGEGGEDGEDRGEGGGEDGEEEGSSDGSSGSSDDGPDDEDGDDDGVQLRGKKTKNHKRSAKKGWKLGGRLAVLKKQTEGASMSEKMVIAGKMHEVRSDLDFGYEQRPAGAEKKKKKKKTKMEQLLDAARASAQAGPDASTSTKITVMKASMIAQDDDEDASR